MVVQGMKVLRVSDTATQWCGRFIRDGVLLRVYDRISGSRR